MDSEGHTERPSVHVHRSESRHEHKSHGPKSGEKQDIGKFLQWTAVIQIILLVFIAFQISDLGGVQVADGGNLPKAAPSEQPSAAAPTVKLDVADYVDDDSVKGDANAPITIVEWSDYECPFCVRFYSETFKQIDEKYIKTGKVKFVYRDFPLSFHQQAQKSAEAAECAGEQGKYYNMHDLLFERGVAGGVASFKSYAKEIGLDTVKFNTCLDSGEMASEVQKDFLDGQAAGIQGTPGFLVNGISVSGAQPFSVFEQIIEAELSS